MKKGGILSTRFSNRVDPEISPVKDERHARSICCHYGWRAGRTVLARESPEASETVASHRRG